MLREENDINEFLAKGYNIIKILSCKNVKDMQEEVFPIFILGLKETTHD